MSKLLQVEGLTRRFGGLVAVNAVSLDLHIGEVHAVIGTNGAGKSTLINMLSGEIAKRYLGADETGALADPDLRTRITRNKMDFDCFYKTIARVAAESKASNGPSAATSIIKYAAATFAQERSELMVEAMGAQGLGWEGEAYAPLELTATHGWLRSKGNSIEGGTSEVNLNVVSKRVLGLPDPK